MPARPIQGLARARRCVVQMLLILIPVAWLALLSFFVILCRAAAAGERAVQATAHGSPPLSISGLRLWEQPSPAGTRELQRLLTGRPTGNRAVRARDARSRRAGCVARS
jgi:hypothetical protein